MVPAPLWALQVSEARLIELLEQVSEQAEKKTKVRGLGTPGMHVGMAVLAAAAKVLPPPAAAAR